MCNAGCRTCQISLDFTSGDADYCTSCDLDTKPILDLGETKPMCKAELPAKRAIVIIQNNRLLGVSMDATPYGGAGSDGNRTNQTNTDPESQLGSNTNTMPPPMNGTSGTSSNSTNGTQPPPQNGTASGTSGAQQPPQNGTAAAGSTNTTNSAQEIMEIVSKYQVAFFVSLSFGIFPRLVK